MPTLLNRNEAADLAGLSVNAVKNALDRKIVPAAVSEGGQSLIDARDVAVLVILASLDTLRAADKRRVRDWLVTDRVSRRLRLNDVLTVERVPHADRAAEEAERYAHLRDKWIVSDPAVRGGEPVVRGSRISVHTLAERLAHGESDEILDRDMPHVPKEAREVTVRYAKTHPRRGRPAARRKLRAA